MSSNLRLSGSLECCPKEWSSQSFPQYIEDNFSEVLEYCEIEIMKGVIVMEEK